MNISEIQEKLDLYNNNYPNKEHLVIELYKKVLPQGRMIFPYEGAIPVQSAVLLLLYPRHEQLHLIFIERTRDNGVHSGQIAFPGGRFDSEAGDRTMTDTALRETCEEVGICAEQIHIIGKLTDVYIPPSNFNVAPYIGYMQTSPVFTMQKDEVSRIIEIPLSDLLSYNDLETSEFETYRGKVFAPCYVWNDTKIWGATAMILSEFLFILQNRN